jgi:hypothetical protein
MHWPDLLSSGSLVRILPGAPVRSSRFSGDLVHVWALVIFAAGSDIVPVFRAVAGWCRSVCLLAGLPGSGGGWSGSPCLGWRAGGVCAGRAGRLGRPGGGGRGEGRAPAAAGFRGQALGGAAFVVFLPGGPGVQDALVADDQQGGGEQHQGCQAHQAAPAAADVVAGGVLGGGEAAFGAGAAGVGAAPGRRRVVVFLRGLGEDVRRDGEGLLGAAGRGMLGGWRISGRSRSRSIDGGCSGQRTLPMAAGHWTRW